MNTQASQLNRRNMIRTTGAALAGAVGATVIHAAPAAAAGFGYTPIEPYRSIDIRSIPSCPSNEFDDWDVWTGQNGSARIPSNAAAVTFNLTATGTEGVPGFLSISPAGARLPDVSTLNWVNAGADVADGGTVKLAPRPIWPRLGVSLVRGWPSREDLVPHRYHRLLQLTASSPPTRRTAGAWPCRWRRGGAARGGSVEPCRSSRRQGFRMPRPCHSASYEMVSVVVRGPDPSRPAGGLRCIRGSTPTQHPDRAAFVMASTGEAVTYREYEAAIEPARPPAALVRPRTTRPLVDLHGEQRPLPRDLRRRRANRALLHAGQLVPHRRGARLHRRQQRVEGADHLAGQA